MISKTSKIYISGHLGMVGASCWKKFIDSGYKNLIGLRSSELDLKNQKKVNDVIKNEKPDVIVNAAAKVGGIVANNNYPYQFLMDNMLIQNNLVNAAFKNNIKKFVFLGSSCIYPKFSKQPIKEEYLLTDMLEPTNQWYAIAKISGVKLIEALRIQYNKDYVALMPTNLYGPNDNFDLNTSHVLPAMIRKFHYAKVNNDDVTLWGTGSPLREFLHVDDLSSAVLFAVENKLPDYLYNVGSGKDISIKNLASTIKNIIRYEGKILWDKSKPDGTPKKLMDSSKLISLGWMPKINLHDGVVSTYDWFLKNLEKLKEVKIS